MNIVLLCSHTEPLGGWLIRLLGHYVETVFVQWCLRNYKR